MSNYVTVCSMGYRPRAMGDENNLQSMVEGVKEYWGRRLARVLADKPDLILLPETCDKPVVSDGKLFEFYNFKGNQLLDFFRKIAKDNSCYIVYSAARKLEDGSWRNSSQLIDRNGEVGLVYNKNFPTESEMLKKGILSGAKVEKYNCDFGDVVCSICFDLNFDEIREMHKNLKPKLVLFSSNFHGGHKAVTWAYETSSYFVGALGYGGSDHCYILSPTGEKIAQSGMDMLVTRKINLDYCVVPMNYNLSKIERAKIQYGMKINVQMSHWEDVALLTSDTEDFTAEDVVRDFKMVTLDEFYDSARKYRSMYRE